jgi:phosphocarrier protein HPr
VTQSVVEREFTVRAELGLHARPAGMFVRTAEGFACEVAVGHRDEWVDGRSILSLLSLAAGCGTVLRVRATGADAEEAVEALGLLIEKTYTDELR